MSETWVLWLTIIGILFLIVGIAIAIWASVNNNQYWYWGAIVAGIGVLLLLIAFILYVTSKETITSSICQQPVVNPCCPPAQPQHTFYDNSMVMGTQVPNYAAVPNPFMQQQYYPGPVGIQAPAMQFAQSPQIVQATAPPMSVQSSTVTVPSLNAGQPLNLPNVINPLPASTVAGTPYLQPINNGVNNFPGSSQMIY